MSNDENKITDGRKLITNEIIRGDCIDIMKQMPAKSIDLIVTSPPYYNAKEYAQYDSYEQYLIKMTGCFRHMERVLKEGRHMIVNTSPVITPRTSRSTNSIRHAIPFDLHPRITALGFDFTDDIIWKKPMGAGNGRSRRFAIDRKPLQYKTEAVTEYVMVYRKHSGMLPETILNAYPKKIIDTSLIRDKYNVTNVWEINPEINSDHPAAYPDMLARDLVRLYSLRGDVVLDPFCGSGTTAYASKTENREYIGIDITEQYCRMAKNRLKQIPLVF